MKGGIQPMRLRDASVYAWLFVLCVLIFGFIHFAHAGNIAFYSNTVRSSAPATSSNQLILFQQINNTIPPSGKIILTPQAGVFTFPVSFDFTDVDLATSTTLLGPFSDRSLAATASAVNDGVVVATGTNGSITITLNSSQGIPANSYIQIELGTNATFGTIGDQRIVNPAAIGTYSFFVETQDAGSARIGNSKTLIAIINPIIVRIEPDQTPPSRFNSHPSGNVPANTTAVEIALNTNEDATCRYDTVASTTYALMPNTFDNTGGTLHAHNIFSLSEGTHSFYVRCADTIFNENTDDFLIVFTVPAPVPPPAPPAAAGFRPFPSPPPAPQISFSGLAYANAKVSILKDGAVQREVIATNRGEFTGLVTGLSQGTFTFGVIGEDSEGRKSLTFNTTISLVSGSRSSVSNLYLSPTIEIDNDTPDPGMPLVFFGESVPSSTIEAWIYPQGQATVNANTVDTIVGFANNASGKYNLSFNTSNLGVGTYALKTRSKNGTIESGFGPLLYFGIGQEPTPDFCSRSDINKDTKVNLVDFSILLFNWQTSDVSSDINLDGGVNLTDFSIMLFCWTG